MIHKYDEPWFTNLDPAAQQHIVDQDFARRDAMRAVEQEASPDDYSPAKLAFVTLCCEQFRDNMREFDKRQRTIHDFNPSHDVLRRAAAELGLTVEERVFLGPCNPSTELGTVNTERQEDPRHART